MGEAEVSSTQSAPKGKVIGVWGPIGAPGRSSVAINLAAELSALGSVLLVDADLRGGSVAAQLGIAEPSLDLVRAGYAAGSKSFSSARLRELVCHHSLGRGRGFSVLPGLNDAVAWSDLSEISLVRLLALARASFAYTILDTAPDISAAGTGLSRESLSLKVLGQADSLVAVVGADPIGVCRFVRSWPDLPKTQSGQAWPINVVANRLRASAVGSRPLGQISETLRGFLPLGSVWPLDYEPRLFDEAVLRSRSAWSLAAGSLRRQFEALARAVVSGPGSPA